MTWWDHPLPKETNKNEFRASLFIVVGLCKGWQTRTLHMSNRQERLHLPLCPIMIAHCNMDIFSKSQGSLTPQETDHTLPKTNTLPVENRPSHTRNATFQPSSTIHSQGRAVSRRVIVPWLSWSPSNYLNQVTCHSTSPLGCQCLQWDTCPENQFGWMLECVSTWTLDFHDSISGASSMATTTTTTTTTTRGHVFVL